MQVRLKAAPHLDHRDDTDKLIAKLWSMPVVKELICPPVVSASGTMSRKRSFAAPNNETPRLQSFENNKRRKLNRLHGIAERAESPITLAPLLLKHPDQIPEALLQAAEAAPNVRDHLHILNLVANSKVPATRSTGNTALDGPSGYITYCRAKSVEAFPVSLAKACGWLSWLFFVSDGRHKPVCLESGI
jgi:hypothetical protein